MDFWIVGRGRDMEDYFVTSPMNNKLSKIIFVVSDAAVK